MTLTNEPVVPLGNADRFFIGGEWVKPSSDATIDVIDSGTEELFFRVPEAKEADMSRAVAAAREAFDEGPWPRMSHASGPSTCERWGPVCRSESEMSGRSGLGNPVSCTRSPRYSRPPGRAHSTTTPGWPTPSRSRSR